MSVKLCKYDHLWFDDGPICKKRVYSSGQNSGEK